MFFHNSQETGIGKLVNKLSKMPDLIGRKAKQVVLTWKALVSDDAKKSLMDRYRGELEAEPGEDKVSG